MPRSVARPVGALPAPRPDHDAACALISVALPGQVVAVSGHLDVHGATDVRLALADAVRAGTGELVVDLAAVHTVDVTGLGVLVGAHRQAGRMGRTLILRDVPEQVRRLLLVTRLDRVLHVSRTIPA